ncbi:cytochrome o ubiquinol oxidase subunit IV [Roseateles sp.]|uniref:cytochrome o ubiquinol oxidase subunit IV n=1 Tax=Roseateles sp. TaxID=1971397 RepID=UPI0039E8C43A
MSAGAPENVEAGDAAPGEASDASSIADEIRVYLVGFVLATLLTMVSFYIARSELVWTPSIPVALGVLAVSQIGVHLVFFLHLTSGPDNKNNLLALAFGLLVVMLLIFGTLWVMGHMNHAHVVPMERLMQMQR